MNRRGKESLNNLTAVSNNAGAGIDGGLSALTQAGQVDNLILSYLGNNKNLEKKYLEGQIGIELSPQGTLAERLRAGGSGVPAFFTPTGARMSRPPKSRGKLNRLLNEMSRYACPVRRNTHPAQPTQGGHDRICRARTRYSQRDQNLRRQDLCDGDRTERRRRHFKSVEGRQGRKLPVSVRYAAS
jgi:hypothetical protein